MDIHNLMSGHESKDARSLTEIYDNAFELLNNINKTQEPTNSPKIQSDVRRAMHMFEDATKLVSMVDMFSKNENFEEVATENIKYFLLPALLGSLTLKICGSDDRMHIVDVAEIYFTDFLKRVNSYGLTDVKIPEPKAAKKEEDDSEKQYNADMILNMVNTRNAKLQKYKEQKDLEARLQTLKQDMENPNVDDETKRNYFVTLVKTYINQAIDELDSLAVERQMLEHMKALEGTGVEPQANQRSHKPKVPTRSLKPIIITRDEVQKQVYGAGYPSLPVLTVQEFYEKRVQDGDWPGPSERNQINATCLQDVANNETPDRTKEDIEDEEKEKKIEEDDSELLAQVRNMDEYKDTHRRGWGNRANRS